MTTEQARELVNQCWAQSNSWGAIVELLVSETDKAYKQGMTEAVASLREHVREQTTVAVPAHEAGGINQVNYRAGMAKAYRDIEKRLTEMEGKQL